VYIYARLELAFRNNAILEYFIQVLMSLQSQAVPLIKRRSGRRRSATAAFDYAQNWQTHGKVCDAYTYRINHRNYEIADRFGQSLKRIGSRISQALSVH
jgi:hypothetical protein